MSKELRSREALYRILAERLREEIHAGHWSLGEQIPTEGELVEEYGVSRATVRQALSVLEHEGYIVTRHGAGRFISRPPGIVSAGIEQLKSITDTIAEQGHKAGMRYHSRTVRAATDDEAKIFGISPDDDVLELRREITADGEVVAYSHDVLPRALLPADFDPKDLNGSVFGLLEKRVGITAKTARAQVHAVKDSAVAKALGLRNVLFILLDQTHFSTTGQPILYSNTYFVEGGFDFTVMRTR